VPIGLRVYVDEMGLDTYIYREKARVARGKKIYGEVSGRKYKRTNIVAARCVGQIIAPLQYNGATDHKLFEWWFVTMLLPILTLGSVIILDNASFHRKAILKTFVEEAGFSIIFLPPYSPDYNLIEHFWASLKSRLKKIIINFPSLDDAITACFQT
jgi:transposase